MNSKQIEDIAIIALKDVIMHSDTHLSPYISENDKEPSWDGFIYLYNSKNHIKKNFEGRVAVQVKGKIAKQLTLQKINYSIEVDDLKSYQKDNGVIFFVVFINESDIKQRIVYYTSLTPVKLALSLKDIGSKKTKSFELIKFPLGTKDQYSVLLNLLKNSQQQVSYSPERIIALDTSIENELTACTYFSETIGLNSLELVQNILSHTEIYFYQKDKFNNLIPTDFFISPNDKFDLEDTLEIEVAINEKVYYTEIQRTLSQNNLIINIGKSFSITLNENQAPQCHFQLNQYVKEGFYDLVFFTDLVKNNNRFTINKKEIEFSIDENSQKGHLKSLEGYVNLYERVIKFLEILNIEGDINLELLSNEKHKLLNVLCKAILDNEEVALIAKDDNPIVNIELSGIWVKLVILKSTENGKYSVHDFFNSKYVGVLKDDNDNISYTSLFCILSANDYNIISNINYDEIYNSFIVLEKLDYIFEIATTNLLKMLLAYDVKPNDKLFSLIQKLSDWIIEKSKENVSYEIKALNHLQIVKRKRQYTQEEITQLIELSENSDIQIKIGANILLDDAIKVNVYLNRLSEEEQKSIKAFPIYKFMKNNIKQI